MIANQCLTMKFLFVAVLVLLNSVVTHQQSSCTLPGRTQQSACVRLHYCTYFQDLIRKYNGRPPPDVVSNIRSHSCGSGDLICCPDNAVDEAYPSLSPPRDLKTKSLNDIENHRNIKLINERTCGAISSNRIVGGVNANIREFPWAALLGYQLVDQLVWQCGGTLISQRFVLTACHCITKELVTVRLGEHTISKQEDCDDSDQCADPIQDIKIDKKIKHPYFTRKTKENDIALLKLVRPADLTKNNVRMICLPITHESDIEEFKKRNDNFVITGWGRTGDQSSSDILQKAFVPFVDLNTCNAIFNPENIQIYPVQLCAGYSQDFKNDKTDTCKGDSGINIEFYFYLINLRNKTGIKYFIFRWWTHGI
ncbi:unnamed protein product [Chironomus riparius]|uniref:Peptidase S1 domain-containing protein n=1 Tax=Chironomus riparius TaxID=315576 RepID=A0A9P0NLJ4_9DIPT|nr:unnamed protein product [Chironomus riparius]